MLVFSILVRVGLDSTNFITKEKIILSIGIFHLGQRLHKSNLSNSPTCMDCSKSSYDCLLEDRLHASCIVPSLLWSLS